MKNLSKIKLKNFKKYGIITHPIFDILVFNKIRQQFGSKIKVLLCASAPMSKDLADDFKVFLSIPVVEGLGMTELAGSAFASNTYDLTNNTAGGLTTGAMMKIVDVPELGYTHNDIIDGYPSPSGEICVKGPLVFVGYSDLPKELLKKMQNPNNQHPLKNSLKY